jgi:hypothetical protein
MEVAEGQAKTSPQLTVGEMSIHGEMPVITSVGLEIWMQRNQELEQEPTE